MEEITFLTQTLSFVCLLILSGFTYILSKKIKFPYTVLLVLFGLLLIPVSWIDLFWFIDDFKLTPEILFFVFLPVLLFEAAYNINYRYILRNWKTISSLAIFWLLISSIVIWVGLFYIFPIVSLKVPFIVCLLFWVLISATDPVAVLSIFKSMWAPRRLTILFEWESLFNDGTAVALFIVILWVILEWWIISWEVYLNWTWTFISMLFGWILFWTFTWILFSNVLWYIKNNEEVEIVFTVLIAHMTFILAELITHHFHYLPISWVIATVIASMIIWNYWKYKITPKVEVQMQKFWELFAFVANSIVFILMWLILSSINIDYKSFILLILVLPVIIVARAISVYIPIGFINKFNLEEKIPESWKILLSWWSLRWALALMMVLMIPWEWDLGYEKIKAYEESIRWVYGFTIKDLLTVLTIWAIMFTLFVKATTIPFLMRYLWVNKLHKLEEFEHKELKILADLKILAKLNSLFKKWYLTLFEYRELKNKYSKNLKFYACKMKIFLLWEKEISEANIIVKRAISLHALWIEKQHLKELLLYNEIDEKNFKYIFRKISMQMEKIELEEANLIDISDDKYNYDIFAKSVIKLFKNHSSTSDTYIRNRTKVIITRKTVDELKELASMDLWFDNKLFDENIELFARFSKEADEKKIWILVKNKDRVMEVESELLNKSLLNLEQNLLTDLFEKWIITQKLYMRFIEEVEDKIYKDIKDLN